MNDEKPVVSICCITYNHEPYIRDCLEGLLMQKTDFPFEVLVHDDASTDRTADIIREYEAKYPDIVKPVCQTENQYSKGVKISIYNMSRARGKYIAFCEGDDYWTDEHKLQKQVRILEAHPECSGCVHNVTVVDGNKTPWPEENQKLFRVSRDEIHDASYLEDTGLFAHLSSVMFRLKLVGDMTEETYQAYRSVKTNGDFLFSALMAANGKVYHIASDMSCYRCVTDGVNSWTSRNRNKNISFLTFSMLMAVRDFIRKYYGADISYRKIGDALCYTSFRYWMKHPSSENFTIMRKMLKTAGFHPASLLLHAAEGIRRRMRKKEKR